MWHLKDNATLLMVNINILIAIICKNGKQFNS